MLVTTPLRLEDAGAGFECRDPDMAAFFAQQAWQFEEQGLVRTFVLRGEEPPGLLGFYSLCAARLITTDVPAAV